MKRLLIFNLIMFVICGISFLYYYINGDTHKMLFNGILAIVNYLTTLIIIYAMGHETIIEGLKSILYYK